ncbi:MAG: glycosyltransferase family 2 protein [Lutibacter sp.]|nr:glycosyltransferase family 2 protein [Lutibacter sp.]
MNGIMNNKLLSICIPTYNRCELLDEALSKLFSNNEFDSNSIEVIVSDNCSTDNTAEVVSKYPLVRYFCNSENVRDRNFSIVLGYATGSYIRLFNDTLSFKDGALKMMLERIEKHLEDNCNLFFYGNMFLNKNSHKEVNSKKIFFKTVSFFTTWIANFGVWRKDFVNIIDKDRYVELQFVQVNWTYRILEKNKKTLIYFDDLFTVNTPNKKGGYNVFDTFVNKYLFIIKQECFSLFDYEIEKFRLCKYFIYPWFITLFVENKPNFSFDTKGAIGIILKKYWYEPYLYPMLLVFWIKKLRR